MSSTTWVATGAVCSALLAACGGAGGNERRYDGERAKVAKVIDELQSASRDGDGKRICEDLFTENLSISVRKASGRSCAKEVTANLKGKDTTFKLSGLKIDGTNATGQLVDQKDRGSSVLLQQEGGSWRIARIGAAAAR